MMKGLKLKRLAAFAFAILMLTSLIAFETPVSAADKEWEYYLEVQISDANNSKTGNGNVFCNLYFNSSDKEAFPVPNTKKSGKFTSTTYTTTRAPWTLDEVELENTNKDAFKFLWIRLSVKLKGSDGDRLYVLGSSSGGWYPSGKGSKDGYWIENERGTDCPSTYSVIVSPEHNPSAAGNFVETMSGEEQIFVDTDSNNDTDIEHKWDGKLTDKYNAILGDYNSLDYPNAPTVTITATGVKGNAKDAVNFKALTQSGAAKELADGEGRVLGYSINPRKLSEYMNKYDVNLITVTAKLEFASGTVYVRAPLMGGKTYKECTYTFKRLAFGVGNPMMKKSGDSPYYSSRDNYYYNASASGIPVEIPIKTDGNNSHITADSLNGAILRYDKAVLELGNTGKTIEIGSSSVTLSGPVIKLYFPLGKDVTSGGDNVRVNLYGATLTPLTSSVNYNYTLWEPDTASKDYSRLASGYKVDTKEPKVTLTSTDGKPLSNTWRRNLSFKSVTSKLTKTIYSDGTYEMFILNPDDGRTTLFLGNGTCTGSSMFIPSGDNFETSRELWLNEKAEGKYRLKITGTDTAGNKLEQYIDDVCLDNKPPVIKINEERGTERDADKTLSNKYKVNISDASGTGKVYYVFTENRKYSPPAFDPVSALEQVTGEFETTLGRWAFIDQATAEKGAAALLKIGVGESYKGRLYYFGVDAFDNKTDMQYIDITMDNEDTDCKVVYPESSTVPQPSYTISFDTNAGNTVRWKWIGSNIFSDYKKWEQTDDIGAAVQKDSYGDVLMNGTYYLSYKVTTPSGTTKERTETFVFDNAGPAVGASLVSGGTFSETATVKVSASDAAGIASATAQVVSPDGKKAFGEKYILDFAGSSASQTLMLSDLPNGKYALSVTATDVYGNETTIDLDEAPVFFIRAEKPEVTAEIERATATYGEYPLTNKRDYTVKIGVDESFVNGDDGVYQYFYYRTSTDMQSFSQWESVNTPIAYDAENERYFAYFNIATPISALVEGENKIFVQTLISAYGKVPDSGTAAGIVTSELTLYYDETAPTYRVIFRDEHTADTLTARLYAFDNLDAGVSVSCDDDSVKPSDTPDESGAFSVVFGESGRFDLIVTDAAGNETVAPVTVAGIDHTAPTVTADANTVPHGDREDVEIYVTATDFEKGKIEFAAVPEKGADAVFDEETLTLDPEIAKVETETESAAAFDEEINGTYKVTVSGVTGEYVVAVRAEDAVGNIVEYISDAFTVTDAETEVVSFDSAPKQTGTRAKVKVKFNVPVKVLPLDRVTEDDEENFGNAKTLPTPYSQDFTFVITENGTYTLLSVDELGRETKSEITVEDVEFGKLESVEVKRYRNADAFNNDTPTPDGEYIPADGFAKIAIVPGKGECVAPISRESLESVNLAVDGDLSVGNNEQGYTLLVLSVGQWCDSETWEVYDSTERFIDLYSFPEGADRETWSEIMAVASYIDNTEPQSEAVSVSPNLATMTDTPILVRSGVTATYTLSDPEVGLKSLNIGDFFALRVGSEIPSREPDPEDPDDEGYYPGPYEFEHGDSLEPNGAETIIPFIDDDGNGIDYSEKPFVKEYTDSDGNVVVRLTLYGDEDPKGTKTLIAEFKNNAGTYHIDLENTLGVRGWVMPIPGGYPEGMIVYNIRKLPKICEDDYEIVYEYVDADGNRVKFDPTAPENADIWYGEGYATVVPKSSGENRGLYVANNGGSFEKKLTVDEPDFTFDIRDAFGDGVTADVSLEHFDIIPGTLSHTLSETAKTNKPVTVTITARDGESGVKSVALYDRNGKEIALAYDETEGVYTAEITESGTYRISMTDFAFNKTDRSFTVSNINTVKPEAAVAYSIDQKTKSRDNVTATLTFDKANTHITAIDPDDSTDLSTITVNYGSSTLRFTENGTVTVYYADDYGNEGDPVSVTVKSIYRVPPSVTTKAPVVNAKKSEVTIGFEKALDSKGVPIDTERELWDLTVMYGGVAKRIVTLDKDGNVAEEATFTFRDNGVYTFKVYDDNGSYSYLTVEISEIDTKAPVIKSFSWSYDYDYLDNGVWTTATESGTINIGTDTSGDEAGYVLSTNGKTEADKKPVTNGDVTVTVTTDDPTRNLGATDDDYSTTGEKVYDDNGLYIFNREKDNGLTDSYGIDIELIDKIPPILRLASEELVFYENPDVGEPFSVDLLTKPGVAFTAYDMFRGKTDLSDAVEIEIDPRFNPDDFYSNTFDRSIVYTVTYRVSDRAHNVVEAKRTIRLVGMYDTIALVDGKLPDAMGRAETDGGKFEVTLANFSGIAYVRYTAGLKTMGEMKKTGTMLTANEKGAFGADGLTGGWYTVYIQTDKRDYILLQIYVNS